MGEGDSFCKLTIFGDCEIKSAPGFLLIISLIIILVFWIGWGASILFIYEPSIINYYY